MLDLDRLLTTSRPKRAQVYIVSAAKHGAFKIGFTQGPLSSRLGGIRAAGGNPFGREIEIDVVHVIDCEDRRSASDVEAKLHARFDAVRIGNTEWFKLIPEHVEWIRVVTCQTQVGVNRRNYRELQDQLVVERLIDDRHEIVGEVMRYLAELRDHRVINKRDARHFEQFLLKLATFGPARTKDVDSGYFFLNPARAEFGMRLHVRGIPTASMHESSIAVDQPAITKPSRKREMGKPRIARGRKRCPWCGDRYRVGKAYAQHIDQCDVRIRRDLELKPIKRGNLSLVISPDGER